MWLSGGFGGGMRLESSPLTDSFNSTINFLRSLNIFTLKLFTFFHSCLTLFISSFKLPATEPCIFFLIPASIAEAVAVIPNGAKAFFAKGVAIFINGSAISLNNDPKNPPDWIILEIWAYKVMNQLTYYY